MDFDMHYKSIAQKLSEHAPKDWHSLIFAGDFSAKDVAQKCIYDAINVEGEKNWFIVRGRDSFVIDDAFRHIQTEMHKLTGNRWNTVEFTVHRDGKFDVDFGYD